MLPEWTFMVFTPQGAPNGTGFAVLRPNVVITAAHVVEAYLPDLPRVLDTSSGRRDIIHRTGSPWENGYVESFNGKLRDERYRPPAPETIMPATLGSLEMSPALS